MDSTKKQISGSETIKVGGTTLNAAAPKRHHLIGATLGGRYLLKRRLGSGGFGEVFLASDERMVSRNVVVKVLRDDTTHNEWSIRKFKQEIEALARIDHPSIVGIFDVGEMPDGKPYIVMQYVEGASLRSSICPEGMDLRRTSNIVRQMGRALSAAHERGVLHRDLKPENIMVQNLCEGEEQVKIIDFGVAKIKDSVVSMSTDRGEAVGTIAYMSPEQLSAGPISAASDVYSFAVIAYEMLTGRRPANPESIFQLLEMQRAGVRVKPVDLRPSLPEAAQTIILKALSFDPKERYHRARDFGDLLASALVRDEEQTVVHSERVPPKAAAKQESKIMPPETAHVLFVDIVGYSELLIDQQRTRLRQLQQIVRDTGEFKGASASKQLIRLPTGDGMALVFFEDPEAPVRCALEISRVLKSNPGIELRMGIHSGLIYRMADINTNMNVAGGGINIAQRVMDCGDGGHILVSKRVADDLGQLTTWASYLHDLGEAEGKHGVRVHVFNLYGEGVGNSEVPAKLRVRARSSFLSAPVSVASLLVLGLIVGGVWYGRRSRNSPRPPPDGREATVSVRPEQSLAYWLTVQKRVGGRFIPELFQSTGTEIYGNGWRFQFNIEPAKPAPSTYSMKDQVRTARLSTTFYFPRRLTEGLRS